MWLAQSMKQAVPTADADQGISTIVGDQMGVVTRGEVRQLPIYGPGGYVWLPVNHFWRNSILKVIIRSILPYSSRMLISCCASAGCR